MTMMMVMMMQVGKEESHELSVHCTAAKRCSWPARNHRRTMRLHGERSMGGPEVRMHAFPFFSKSAAQES
eukprot:11249364-Karenia_brevis.AAC.1